MESLTEAKEKYPKITHLLLDFFQTPAVVVRIVFEFCSGICYRLYSEEQYEEMESRNTPDILLTNLTEVLLYIIAAGVNLTEFDFIEKPDPGVLLYSQALLRYFFFRLQIPNFVKLH